MKLSPGMLTPPIGLILYTVCTIAFCKTPTPPPPPEKKSITREAIPSWDFVNPEADQMVEELRMEKKTLDARQKQLDDQAKTLDSQSADLAKVKQAVAKMQKDYDQIVLRVQDEEIANLKRLAKVYSAMTPETAAVVLAQMDDPAIVKILMFMKDADAATVLESLAKKGDAEAKRAAALSERLRLSSHNTTPAK